MEGSGFVFKKSETPFNPTGVNDGQQIYKGEQKQFQLGYDPEIIKKVSGTLKIKGQTGGLAVNAYGSRFEEKLNENERKAAAKKEGSELNIKAQCKSLVEGAEKEFNDRYDKLRKKTLKKNDIKGIEADFENILYLLHFEDTKFNSSVLKDYKAGGEKRFHALDMLLEDFVNMDFSFDLSSDETISVYSVKFIQLRKISDSFMTLVSLNPEYWSAVDGDSKAAVMQKIYQAEHLWDYYSKREKVICDEVYSTHMDSEIAFANFESKNAGKMAKYQLLTKKLAEAELSYDKLRLMDDEHKDEKAARLLSEKQNDQMLLDHVVVPKGRTAKSKSRGFSWLDVFGWPLKAVSFFMRRKRSTDHGSSRYEEMKREALHKFPSEMGNIGMPGSEHKFIPQRTENSPTPKIELDPLFKDDVKVMINKILDDYDGVQYQDGDDPKEIESMQLYEEFMDAAQLYTRLGGVVNADTTEMEMAFLDKMSELEKQFDKTHKPNLLVTERMVLRLEAVKNVMMQIRRNFYGNLKNVVAEDMFESAVRNSTAVILDTDIDDNMLESNIKNIPLFTHTPNINDVKQSTIGDCYLVGAMTSFVKTGAQSVLNMFQDLGDGNVLVRLYAPYDNNGRVDSLERWNTSSDSGTLNMKPIFVKVRKHYETGDGNANDCVWPQLLEKAFAAAGLNMKGEASVDENGMLHEMVKELTCGYGFMALSSLTGTVQKRYFPQEKLTDEENTLKKNEFFTTVFSEAVLQRLGAGIPRYIWEDLIDNISDNDAKMMCYEIMEYRLGCSVDRCVAAYGSSLMQIYKDFLRQGKAEEGRQTVEKFAAALGMPLRKGWDTIRVNKGKNLSGEIKTEDFDLNRDHQRWDMIFAEDIIDRMKAKFKENYENVCKGRPVTFDTVNGKDTEAFNDESISKFVVDVEEKLRRAGEGIDDVLPEVLADIELCGNLWGNEAVKKDAIKAHSEKYADWWSKEDNVRTAAYHTYSMQTDGHDKIRADMMEFVARLSEALSRGGSVEISINHFVSAVGMKIVRNQCYVLIKDPFNVYNMEYGTDINGVPKMHEDSFLDVLSISGHSKKRHLNEVGDVNENFYGGYRGLSYWKLEDLYAKMKDYTPVFKEHVK